MLREKELYKICDTMEEVAVNLTDGWYPTVQELKDHNVEGNPEKYTPIISFFSSDPFTRMSIPGAEEEEYRDTVKFCKKLLYRISEKIIKK